MEVVSLWEPGEGRGLDNLPTRGFAGQLLFFTYKDPTPALVDGQVTVYVFDDRGTEADQSKPLWQRTFAPQEWNTFALQTNLGTAYQIFIPYTRKGIDEAHCSLRIKLEPTDGGSPVYSKMANVVLSGSNHDAPELEISHRRIEPQPLDADPSAEPALRPLRSSTVSMPGRKSVNAQMAARLREVTRDMLDEEQAAGGIQQAAYFTPGADDEANADLEDEETAPSNRYRLYR